ncbi:MAG: ECF transporter S component [Sarcina sp.]
MKNNKLEVLENLGKTETQSKYTTKRIVLIAMFAAICFVATMVHVPLNLGGSATMIHLGTTAIFVGAIFLGKDIGWSAAIGCALFDFINPAFAIWTIPTFFLKGATGYVAGKVSHHKAKNGEDMKYNILGFVLGGLVSLVGYFIVNCFFYGVPAASAKITTSIITTGIGIAIAVPLCASKFLVKKAGIKI